MKIPKFLKRKRNIWIIIILIVVIGGGFFLFSRKGNKTAIQITSVEKQNIQETVLSTGQVVSGTNLDLSFQGSGIVRRVSVKEGDQVYSGQILASLDQASALASLTTAQGSLAQANANYEKLVAGATPENIKTVEDSVVQAKQSLSDAYDSAINTLSTAYTSMYNAYSVVITIQNTYFTSSDQATITVSSARNDMNINMQSAKGQLDTAKSSSTSSDTDVAISKMISALNNVYNDLMVLRNQCDQGVYYATVTASDKLSLDSQKTLISTALTNVTAVRQAISSAKNTLQKAEDQLNFTTAAPTPAEIDAAKATILSAEGQVASAQAILNNLILRAPENGTITQVDVKVGEQATAMSKVMTLQNINDLHAEADVSEANIASLNIGQSIDYTFDALGPDRHFTGKVLTVNPAATVISGVVNYLVKGSFDNVPGIKPGMTANMTILVAKKDNALAVPSTAVINKNSKQYVRVIDDVDKKTYHEVQVQTGLQADGGLVEIISGLSEGQKIVSYMPL